MTIPTPHPASSIRDVGSALAYLESLRNAERMLPSEARPLLSLTSMRRLAAALWPADGIPNHQPAIHIAGSKGKGTVATLVGAGLHAAGLKVGVYTSPHLVNITERIAIDGVTIPQQKFVNLLRYVAGVEERSRGDRAPATQFEVMTAAAFEYFNFEKCAVVVIETGLGGEHDATNILAPMLSILTAIQLEHTELLGDTVTQIARAKAGIIKAGVPALTFTQTSAVMEVFSGQADAMGCALFVLEDNYNCYFDGDRGIIKLIPQPGRPEGEFEFTPAIPGRTNAFNAALAFLACELCVDLLTEHNSASGGRTGLNPPAPARRSATRERGPTLARVIGAFEKATPLGRFDRRELSVPAPDGTIHRVDAVIDGAHTPESLAAFIAASRQRHVTSLSVVFGCANDKRVDEMLTLLAGAAGHVIFVASPRLGERGCSPKLLAEKFANLLLTARSGRPVTYDTAVDVAGGLLKITLGQGPVCICGSFAIAGDALALAAAAK
jgi:dihydrofolate synthase/folylpolyglutamate synthase